MFAAKRQRKYTSVELKHGLIGRAAALVIWDAWGLLAAGSREAASPVGEMMSRSVSAERYVGEEGSTRENARQDKTLH